MELQSQLCYSFYKCTFGDGEVSSFIPICKIEDGAANRHLIGRIPLNKVRLFSSYKPLSSYNLHWKRGTDIENWSFIVLLVKKYIKNINIILLSFTVMRAILLRWGQYILPNTDWQYIGSEREKKKG